MVQEGISLVFILGAGALLLRPGDFPLFARAAGRLVGLTVRSMRATKEAAEKAIKESADTAHRQNPEMVIIRENLKQSFDKLESLATTVRRDIADVPLNPTLFLKKGLRSWQNATRDPGRSAIDLNQRKKHKDGNTLTAVPRTVQPRGDTYAVSGNASNFQKDPRNSRAVKGSDQFMSGADLMLRVIEEAALARQERYIFGKGKHLDEGPGSDNSTNSATDV